MPGRRGAIPLGSGHAVDDVLIVDPVETLEREGRAGTVAQQPFQARAIPLLLRELDHLREHRPVGPILQRRLEEWLGQLREHDREQWRHRLVAAH